MGTPHFYFQLPVRSININNQLAKFEKNLSQGRFHFSGMTLKGVTTKKIHKSNSNEWEMKIKEYKDRNLVLFIKFRSFEIVVCSLGKKQKERL